MTTVAVYLLGVWAFFVIPILLAFFIHGHQCGLRMLQDSARWADPKTRLPS